MKWKKQETEKIEKQLQRSELKYRAIYDGSPDLQRTVNTDGIIIDCNKKYFESLGYTRDEVIGKSSFSVSCFFHFIFLS